MRIKENKNVVRLLMLLLLLVLPCCAGTSNYMVKSEKPAENKTFLPAQLEVGKVYYVLTQIMLDELKEKVRLVPVKRNSEYWERVKEWENELTFIKPEEGAIVSWENKKREEIKNVVNYYNSLFAEEKQKYQGLDANDGR